MNDKEKLHFVALSLQFKLDDFKKTKFCHNKYTEDLIIQYTSDKKPKNGFFYYEDSVEAIATNFSLYDGNCYYIAFPLDYFTSALSKLNEFEDYFDHEISFDLEKSIINKFIDNYTPIESIEKIILVGIYEDELFSELKKQAGYCDSKVHDFYEFMYEVEKIYSGNTCEYKFIFVRMSESLFKNRVNLDNLKQLNYILNKHNEYLLYLKEHFEEMNDLSLKNEYDEYIKNNQFWRIISVSNYHCNSEVSFYYAVIEALIDFRFDAKYYNVICDVINLTPLFQLSNNKNLFFTQILRDFYMYQGDNPYIEFLLNENDFKQCYDKFFKQGFDKYGTHTSHPQKNVFDLFASKLLFWLYKYNDDKYIELITRLEEYFEMFESNYPEYNDIIETMHNYKNIQNINTEADLIYNEQKICQSSIFKDIDLQKLKNENEEWYKWLLNGEYIFELLSTSQLIDDFSGSIIYWCKCVESMAKNKIYDLATSNITLLKQDSQRRIFDTMNQTFTLGTISFIFKDDNIVQDMFYKIVQRRKTITLQEFQTVITGIIELNSKRRDTAHPKVVNVSDANVCKHIIFISKKIIKLLQKI